VLKGFTQLLAFQAAGVLMNMLFHLPVPGPVIGMLLMLVYCLVFTPGTELQQTSQGLLAMLPLFILPASAGIVDYGPLLRSAWFPISLALVSSLVISFWATPYLFRFFLRVFGVRA
jgi:holin-like protein